MGHTCPKQPFELLDEIPESVKITTICPVVGVNENY